MLLHGEDTLEEWSTGCMCYLYLMMIAVWNKGATTSLPVNQCSHIPGIGHPKVGFSQHFLCSVAYFNCCCVLFMHHYLWNSCIWIHAVNITVFPWSADNPRQWLLDISIEYNFSIPAGYMSCTVCLFGRWHHFIPSLGHRICIWGADGITTTCFHHEYKDGVLYPVICL